MYEVMYEIRLQKNFIGQLCRNAIISNLCRFEACRRRLTVGQKVWKLPTKTI